MQVIIITGKVTGGLEKWGQRHGIGLTADEPQSGLRRCEGWKWLVIVFTCRFIVSNGDRRYSFTGFCITAPKLLQIVRVRN